MPVEYAQQPEIQRHRAAIKRSDLSVPLKCVLRDNLLAHGDSLFDYGCGHGDDIRHLQEIGFACDGWDPTHRPDVPRRPADAVNLGYVLNVIEDIQERAQTLREAWELCRKLLVVAARIAVGDGGEFGAEYGDGVLTRLGTFQKLYTQAELREYLQGVLEADAVPAAPGVFYVFKDAELGERYFASRYRRHGTTPRQRTSERRFEEHRALLEPLLAKLAELGRLPFPDELPESHDLVAVFGSLKRAFALIRRVTGTEVWERLRQERIDDLTVYLALSRFRKRPPISSLPLDLQRDIREFFGNYTRACETADACLFRAGDPEAIDQACQRSPVGRLTSNALFVHKSAVAALEPILRIYEGCARAYLGEIDDANIVKLHRFSGKLSYLACPDFDTVPHPAIQRTVKLSLRSRELDCRDHTEGRKGVRSILPERPGGCCAQNAPAPFSAEDDVLVLDQKERLVAHDHPLREKFARFTEQEQQHGLLDAMVDLRTRRQWELMLDEAGLHLRGYRLLWKPGAVRRRPIKRPAIAASETPVDGDSIEADVCEAEPAGPATDLAEVASEWTAVAPAVDGEVSAAAETSNAALPLRSRRYGVGKEIGGSVYVHRQYEDQLGPDVLGAKRLLPADFVYDVVKYNRRTQAVSFIQCPAFDLEPEPSIAGVVTVRADGTLLRRAVSSDPPVYHHKWLFVADDYTGFDVEESKRRSASWLTLPDVDKSRIGRWSYWHAHVVPRLSACP